MDKIAHNLSRSGRLLCALLLALASRGLAQELDAKSLAAEALRNGSGEFALSEYTHLQKITRRSVRKDGTVEEKSTVSEAFVPKGQQAGKRTRWVYVQIEEDGRPLPADRVEKERLRAGERLLKAEQQAPAAAAVEDARGIYFGIQIGNFLSGVTFDVRTILRRCEFQEAGREFIEGRPAALLTFRPPTAVLFSGEEEYLNRLTGRAWIDLQERILVKLEGWPLDAPGREARPYVEYESLRTPEGKWLPRRIAIYCDGRKRFFKKDYRDVIADFSRYERFGATIREVQIK